MDLGWNYLDAAIPASVFGARSFNHAMAYDSTTGKVMLFGGVGANNGDYGGIPFGDTWEWDGKTWQQLSTATQPAPRYTCTMDFDPSSDGLILFGGELDGDIVTNETWLLAPAVVP